MTPSPHYNCSPGFPNPGITSSWTSEEKFMVFPITKGSWSWSMTSTASGLRELLWAPSPLGLSHSVCQASSSPPTMGCHSSPQFSAFLLSRGIQHVHMSFNNPKANSGLECFDRTLRNGIRPPRGACLILPGSRPCYTTGLHSTHPQRSHQPPLC